MVALRLEDGKALRKTPYSQGRYNAATPVVDGQTVVYAGPTRGVTAEQLTLKGEEMTGEILWANPDNSLQYNTPVIRDGLLFGLSNQSNLFCINVKTGETAWNAPIGSVAAAQPAESQRRPGGAAQRANGQQEERRQEDGRRRGTGRRRGGGGRGGYGSIVDAGSILLALSPASELIVFEPNGEAYTEITKYKVADSPTHAYPVASGNRIFVKDSESLTLWLVDDRI